MRKAEAEDKQLVIDILVESFNDNPSVNYVVKQDRNRIKRIADLMDYSFELCMLFGEVWINEEKTGCALVLYPHKKTTTIRTIFLDLKLVARSIGFSRFPMILKRESKIKNRHPRGMLTYLWFIGVNPQNQNKGIGSSLLGGLITHSNTKNWPIVLETSVPKNVDWYKNFGFKLSAEIDLSYTLFIMKREPSTT